MSELNQKLFENYKTTHSNYLDGSNHKQQIRLDARANKNYTHLLPANKSANILEIGCNKGFFLTWLTNKGYSNLTGIDLSPGDLEEAEKYTGLSDLYCMDALDYIKDKDETYDLIIFRAVFEHIEKIYSEHFLQSVGKALKPDGTVLVEVPNMDWFIASHERYMDFTHEVGFTRESLRQLLSLYYSVVDINKIEEGYFTFSGMVRIKLLKPIIRTIIKVVFSIMGEGAADTWWSNRNILGIAKNFKKSHQ
ncbi:MAG: class I SAM-dependent methyltransferase [Ignavibacteriae bacterium]|nr:class I SAM-dependent methyltransferase [Ignavibacteriota bacterium]